MNADEAAAVVAELKGIGAAMRGLVARAKQLTGSSSGNGNVQLTGITGEMAEALRGGVSAVENYTNPDGRCWEGLYFVRTWDGSIGLDVWASHDLPRQAETAAPAAEGA